MTINASEPRKTGRTGIPLYFWEEAAQHWADSTASGRPRLPEYVTRTLRAVREGIGREAGTVSGMRHAHRVPLPDGADHLPPRYIAEHAVLTLFAMHQHAASTPVHQPGTGLGTAFRRLRQSEATSEAALQQRLISAATSHDLDELTQHLRRTVPFLRQEGIGLDYTRLLNDMAVWGGPGRDRVLRTWGLQYTDPCTKETNENGQSPEPAPPAYWATFQHDSPEGASELAALRGGIGREAGTAPAMWSFHRTAMASKWRDKGALTRDLMAEHTVLTLFARHQQSADRTMHVKGQSLGRAAGLLSGKTTANAESRSGADALRRRFGILLTSVTAEELGMHLRFLVPLLNRSGIGLDYDLLRTALRYWDDPRHPDAAMRYRKQWDHDFHTAASS